MRIRRQTCVAVFKHIYYKCVYHKSVCSLTESKLQYIACVHSFIMINCTDMKKLLTFIAVNMYINMLCAENIWTWEGQANRGMEEIA